MLNITTLLNAFGRDFPKRLATPYGDYVGLMCGTLPKTVRQVVVLLDMEPLLLPDILAIKPDLILTHHPLIYGTRRSVFKHDPSKQALVLALEKHRIPVYSLHTNFDAGRGGMNDALALALGLEQIQPLKGDPLARGGRLPHPMNREAFAKFVKTQLGLPFVQLIPAGKPRIETVALIGGGGAKYFTTAQQEGYDIFISGDSVHHVRRAIVNAQYNYLDILHEVESIFIPTMATYLKKLDQDLTVITRFKQAFPILV